LGGITQRRRNPYSGGGVLSREGSFLDGDHRVVLSLAILATCVQSSVEIDGAEVVAKFS
jgi:5-enolpyruvylshikimate-3-phosphate synthase